MSITRQNLSVIIVSYKSEYVIENCINSIDNQIEIIVIDNSNNEDLKKKIESKYKNVKCILSKKNLGMGAGNNLGIKNVNKDFVLILNPDVSLEKNSINEIFIAANEINNFGVIAPISNKVEYPNYILKKGCNFDLVKPFKVKSVDGYAMLLNLRRLKKIDNFNFFDENFFLYLENEDLCKRLTENDEDIYVIPKSKINHLGGGAVDPKYRNEIEYLRNWHWMWSKFYFQKKYNGYFFSLINSLPKVASTIFKIMLYLFLFNKKKTLIYCHRLWGVTCASIGQSSWYRPRIKS